MKHVVSISIGSSSRNHKAEIDIFGEHFVIERLGTDGDLSQAINMVRELDGKVDAFGMGGIDLYVYAGNRRYAFRDAKRIAQAAQKSPIVDGSGLKNSLERWVVSYIDGQTDIPLRGKKVLMTSAVDRFGMAEAFTELGCDMIFGDVAFALGLPYKLHTLKALNRVARAVLPIAVQLPFQIFYPTGNKQESSKPRFGDWFNWADIVAGDFHYIWRNLPERLDGKVILTNTVTSSNIEELRKRGVACLITTTPDLGGRSFGTNVMEAVLTTVSGKRPEDLHAEDYLKLLRDIGFRPRIERFSA